MKLLSIRHDTVKRLTTFSPVRYSRWIAPLCLLSASQFALAGDPLAEGWLLAASDPATEADTWYFDDVPTVLTPARLKQPRSEVPASVTVITHQDINALGIRNLHDVFRLVPGMTVGYVGANVPVTSYHGTNANEQRRLQVLVDGRSVYNPNLASVDWLNLPVALEDIDRIEVTRGPNTAAYGANAFLAVVNIITRHPEDTHGGRVFGETGSIGDQKRFARWGGRAGEFQYRASVHDKREQGFDYRRDGQTPFRDSYDLAGANLVLLWNRSDNQRWYLDAGLLNGDQQVPRNEGDGQATDPDIRARDNYLSTRIDWDVSPDLNLKLTAYTQQRVRDQPFTACVHPVLFSPALTRLYASNQTYGSILIGADSSFLGGLYTTIAGGGSSGIGSASDDQLALLVINDMLNPPVPEVCGDTNLSIRERRNELEVQSIWTPTPEIRVLGGVSWRQDRFWSETYFDGFGRNRVLSAFFSSEYRPAYRWVVHLGGMAEDDQANGFNFSPRAALNYHITSQVTLRAVVSHAIRTPDTYEQSAQWQFTARNLTPPLNGATEARTFTVRSPGGLQKEQIVARELGLYINLPSQGLELDVKVYRDHLWDLISAPLNYFSFDPENNLDVTQTGLEIEGRWQAGRRDTLRWTYAYMDQDEQYTGNKLFLPQYTGFSQNRLFEIERRLSAQHSGSLAWMRQWPQNLSTAVVYYIADSIGEFDYQRLDVRAGWRKRLSSHLSVEFSVKVEHYLNDDPVMFKDNVYDDRTHYFAQVALNL
ncbi:TonB-dependent receptor [Hahella sp. SMD15-11]|uniref:TonB-dependent receptor n=1 Tax=Thermohahella caldifontis TaxID=3142973 RepID=A0AB39UYI5_9GAMM